MTAAAESRAIRSAKRFCLLVSRRLQEVSEACDCKSVRGLEFRLVTRLQEGNGAGASELHVDEAI